MAWYNESWLYRLKVTVESDNVDADLSDFPVYVDLSALPADFHTNVKTGGVDIRVTTNDGETEVPREVVFYDEDTDTGELHFKGDILSGTDVDFYIYYGNSGASDYAIDDTYGAENVWNTNYINVQHFNEEPDNSTGQILDSTSNDNDGTSKNMETTDRVAGDVGYAFDLDGSNEYIDFVDQCDMGTNDWTVEIVFSTTNRQQSIISKSSYRANFGRWFTYSGSDGKPHMGYDIGSGGQEAASSTAYGTGPDFMSCRWDRDGNQTIRLNKTETGTNNISGGSAQNLQNTDYLYFGAYPNNTGQAPQAGYYFDGTISEVRISNSLRTAAWTDTTYNNLMAVSSFLIIGDQESGAVDVSVGADLVTVTLSQPSPTISTTTNISVYIGVVTFTSSLPTPSVVIDESISVSQINATISLPTPTVVTAVDVTLEPDALELTSSLTTTTVTTVKSISVDADIEQLSLSIPSPTVSLAKSVTVNPNVISIISAVQLPSVSGGVVLSLDEIAITSSVQNLSISVGDGATPAQLDISLSLPIPTVTVEQNISIGADVVVLTGSLPSPHLSTELGNINYYDGSWILDQLQVYEGSWGNALLKYYDGSWQTA